MTSFFYRVTNAMYSNKSVFIIWQNLYMYLVKKKISQRKIENLITGIFKHSINVTLWHLVNYQYCQSSAFIIHPLYFCLNVRSIETCNILPQNSPKWQTSVYLFPFPNMYWSEWFVIWSAYLLRAASHV